MLYLFDLHYFKIFNNHFMLQYEKQSGKKYSISQQQIKNNVSITRNTWKKNLRNVYVINRIIRK